MTLDDVKKIRADMRPGHHILTDDVVEAIDWLADALREAQAQTVQMREDAALTVEDCLRTGLLTPGNVKTAAAQVRRLPLPAPVAAPKPAFDAEAALLAAIEATRTGLDMSPTQTAREVARLLRRMLSDAIAAGRGAR